MAWIDRWRRYYFRWDKQMEEATRSDVLLVRCIRQRRPGERECWEAEHRLPASQRGTPDDPREHFDNMLCNRLAAAGIFRMEQLAELLPYEASYIDGIGDRSCEKITKRVTAWRRSRLKVLED